MFSDAFRHGGRTRATMMCETMEKTFSIDAVQLQASELESGRLRRLIDYWQAIRGADTLPPRERFDPSAIGYILPRTIFVEVRRDAGGYYLRVVGTGIEAAGHQGYQGKGLSEVEPAHYRDLVRRHYDEAVTARAPRAYRISQAGADRKFGRPTSYERVALPLGDAAGEVGFLLVGSDWPGEPAVAGAAARDASSRARA
jgi:hypothetical protein